MMTLAINIPITEQDIKHVWQSNDLWKLYTVHLKDLCFVYVNSTGRCNADLPSFQQPMFKRRFYAQNDRFKQITVTNYFPKMLIKCWKL